MLCPLWIDEWLGLEVGGPKPQGSLRSVRSNPSHPIQPLNAADAVLGFGSMTWQLTQTILQGTVRGATNGVIRSMRQDLGGLRFAHSIAACSFVYK